MRRRQDIASKTLTTVRSSIICSRSRENNCVVIIVNFDRETLHLRYRPWRFGGNLLSNHAHNVSVKSMSGSQCHLERSFDRGSYPTQVMPSGEFQQTYSRPTYSGLSSVRVLIRGCPPLRS